MQNYSHDEVSRFWSLIDRAEQSSCWPWLGGKNSAGYGVYSCPGKKAVLAHRLSLAIATGGMQDTFALHGCDNPICCNPNHLRWGSYKDNVADAIKRKRFVKPPSVRLNPEWEARRIDAMPKGEQVHNQSLTEAEAREIMRLHMAGLDGSKIAEAVGKPKHVVSDVCRGRSWRHLDGIPSIEQLKGGGVRRGTNQFHPGCDTRSLSPTAKIRSDQIPDILKRIRNGETLKAIGETYGVTKGTISKIKIKHS